MALPDMHTEPVELRFAQASEWVMPRPLQWALGLSVGLHIGALLGVPGWLPQQPEPPPLLQVTLRPAAPAQRPAPIAAVQQPTGPLRSTPLPPLVAARPATTPTLPEPAAAPPKLVSRSAAPSAKTRAAVPVQHKPLDPPPAARAETERVTANSADPAPMPILATAPSAAVQAEPAGQPSTTPSSLPAPVVTAAPVAAPPAAASPAQLEAYGATLGKLFAGEQQYPRLAAMRGWEGEVVLRISIARKGKLVAVRILRSSGHEVLDRNAESLVSALSPFPPPPDELSAPELEVTVPIHYRLRQAS